MDEAKRLLEMKLDDIQLLLDRALINPEWALRHVMDAKTALYEARQIIKNELVGGLHE